MKMDVRYVHKGSVLDPYMICDDLLRDYLKLACMYVINTWPVKPFETVPVIKGDTNLI